MRAARVQPGLVRRKALRADAAERAGRTGDCRVGVAQPGEQVIEAVLLGGEIDEDVHDGHDRTPAQATVTITCR